MPRQNLFLMRFTLFSLCCVMLIHSAPAYSYGVCRCKNTDITPLERYDRAFAVFTGKVVRIRRRLNPDRQLITFDVKDSWKGARFEQMTVRTSSRDYVSLLEGVSCGYKFKKRKEYLIFSYKKRNTNELSYTSNCGNIIPLSQANEHIKHFGEPTWQFNKPKPAFIRPDPTAIDNTTQSIPKPPTLTIPLTNSTSETEQ